MTCIVNVEARKAAFAADFFGSVKQFFIKMEDY